MPKLIPVSCSKDCSGGCPLLAYVENGVLQRITPNAAAAPGTLLGQSGCINGFQMPRTVYHPDRITHPLIRTGPRGSGQFRQAAWEEALDLVSNRLADVREQYGATSVLNLVGTGSVSGGLHNTYALPKRFFALFGGSTQFHGSYSAGAYSFAVPYVLGEKRCSGIDPGTLQHSALIILWGANTMDTHMGSETGPRLLQASRSGTPVIVIDPRRTRSVEQLQAEWIPCLPGTDTALMQAVLYVMLSEGLVDWDFARRTSVGFDRLADHVLGRKDGVARDPAWGEVICGTPAKTIVSLARRYGASKPTALLPGYSVQRTLNGEDSFRMAIALQVATANLGRLGGSSGDVIGRLPGPQFQWLPIPSQPPQPSIPVLRWPDAVLDGTAGGYPTDIHMIYSTGGNYLIQGSDVHKNVRAFQKVDFAVCHDYFLTPTAQHCDVVLPVTTFLERNDIVLPDAGNYLLFSNQAVQAVGESRNDYDIFCALADRLGFGQVFSEGKSEEDWLRFMLDGSDVPDYEAFKQSGIYLAPDQMRVGLADFVSDPAAHPLGTPSGKIEISSQRYQENTGFPDIPVYQAQEVDPEYPLLLITPKSRFRIHSQGSNVPWMRQREQQALWIHPQDALQRGMEDGQTVEIFNERGRVRILARVTEEIMPGVVCLLEGVWAAVDEDGVDTAGSANLLSSTDGTQPSQSVTTHGVPVQVKSA
jgi:anaerobic dimethyl sulfoxide reductase subunit A